jgi:hypothetical protein
LDSDSNQQLILFSALELKALAKKGFKESGKNNLNIYLNRPMIKAWDQVGIVTYVESGHS